MAQIKGNSDKEEFRKTREWINWRKLLLQDYNGHCACCGRNTKHPQLHHIFPEQYKVLVKSYFVFVCRDCHKQLSLLERINPENYHKYDQSWLSCFGRFVGRVLNFRSKANDCTFG